jgi:hypothetical protein
VIAKRTFQVVRGRCVEAPEQLALVEAQKPGEDGVTLDHDVDIGVHREEVDLIVRGHAYAHEGRPAFHASIRAGRDFVRDLLVSGDRRCEYGTDGILRFSPPEPVTRVALRWENAYGGMDAVAYRRHGDPLEALHRQAQIPFDPRFSGHGYPRNPLGKGYLTSLDREAVLECQLPNLEDPACPLRPDRLTWNGIRAWPLAPQVAATEFLPYGFFPRSAWAALPLMPYDVRIARPEDFFEVRAGILRPAGVALEPGAHFETRFDPRVAQSAPPSMRLPRVAPDETFELTHLHAAWAVWTFQLPGEVPTVYARLPGAQTERLTPEIRTVMIEPDLDRVTVVWVAARELAAPLPDAQIDQIEHAVVWR